MPQDMVVRVSPTVTVLLRRTAMSDQAPESVLPEKVIAKNAVQV